MLESKPSILVVDDTPANLTLMTGLLQDDYQVRAATSGEKALKIAFSDNPPDLILLDIMMPEMDGHEVCRRLKADDKTREIPIIFLTAMSEAEDEEKGLKLGAVDYITKPVSPPIALARIYTHITMHRQKKALVLSQQMLAAEINEAADYILSALPAELDGEIVTRWKHIPSTALGGDAFGYHWVDPDHLAIYLLDVCGHGVGSALMSVSAINALRSQSLKAADFKQPASVLAAINNAFLMEDHNNKFFTMWYGVYNRADHTLIYASAAHPPAFIRTGDTADKTELLELMTGNMAIGFMEDSTFKEAILPLKKFNQLTVYSDGVYEIEKTGGEMVTLHEYTDIMKKITDIKTTHVDSILKTMKALQATEGPFEDDFSLLQINIHRA
ncbi:MAG: SpoIIE family protein phosphatase [Methylophilales bacterium]|nr:SpoIIE family protein phosphatase [Methylophilales bacterium]